MTELETLVGANTDDSVATAIPAEAVAADTVAELTEDQRRAKQSEADKQFATSIKLAVLALVAFFTGGKKSKEGLVMEIDRLLVKSMKEKQKVSDITGFYQGQRSLLERYEHNHDQMWEELRELSRTALDSNIKIAGQTGVHIGQGPGNTGLAAAEYATIYYDLDASKAERIKIAANAIKVESERATAEADALKNSRN